MQQLEQDAVAALVALAVVVQQRQADLAVGQVVLAAVLADHLVEAGEDLLADGVEVAQLEVVVDVEDAVHYLEHGAGPHAQRVGLLAALRGVDQQLQRVGRSGHGGRDQLLLAGRQKGGDDEFERLLVGAADQRGGGRLVQVEAVFAGELAGVVQVAQGQLAQVDGRDAAGDGVQIAPVEREAALALQRGVQSGHVGPVVGAAPRATAAAARGINVAARGGAVGLQRFSIAARPIVVNQYAPPPAKTCDRQLVAILA